MQTKGTYNQNDNGAYCTACIIKSIPIWKSYLKATFLSLIFVIIVHVRAGQREVGGTEAFIASLGSWHPDGPACQQPSLNFQGNFSSSCRNDLLSMSALSSACSLGRVTITWNGLARPIWFSTFRLLGHWISRVAVPWGFWREGGLPEWSLRTLAWLCLLGQLWVGLCEWEPESHRVVVSTQHLRGNIYSAVALTWIWPWPWPLWATEAAASHPLLFPVLEGPFCHVCEWGGKEQVWWSGGKLQRLGMPCSVSASASPPLTLSCDQPGLHLTPLSMAPPRLRLWAQIWQLCPTGTPASSWVCIGHS